MGNFNFILFNFEVSVHFDLNSATTQHEKFVFIIMFVYHGADTYGELFACDTDDYSSQHEWHVPF